MTMIFNTNSSQLLLWKLSSLSRWMEEADNYPCLFLFQADVTVFVFLLVVHIFPSFIRATDTIVSEG